MFKPIEEGRWRGKGVLGGDGVLGVELDSKFQKDDE